MGLLAGSLTGPPRVRPGVLRSTRVSAPDPAVIARLYAEYDSELVT